MIIHSLPRQRDVSTQTRIVWRFENEVQQLLARETLPRLLQGLLGCFQFPNRLSQSAPELGLVKKLTLHIGELFADGVLSALHRALREAAEQREELLVEQRAILLDDLAPHIRRTGLDESLDDPHTVLLRFEHLRRDAVFAENHFDH